MSNQPIKTFRKIKLEYFAIIWNEMKGHKAKTAKALGITLRCAYNYKRECLALGYDLVEKEVVGINNMMGENCPSNKARIRYLDEMINRDSL